MTSRMSREGTDHRTSVAGHGPPAIGRRPSAAGLRPQLPPGQGARTSVSCVQIEVAVIPCAGAGTRMRPATRVVPKPLIPVVDRPVIQYVVEEAVAAGATEIVLVVDERPGNPVLAHFTDYPPVPGLEAVTFRSVIQPEPKGLGDAVLRARDAVGDRPFLCLVSDMFPRPGRSSTGRLAEIADGGAAIALRRVSPDFYDRYGMVAIGENVTGDVVEIEAAVEKPGAGAPSDLGIVGRYAFPPRCSPSSPTSRPGTGANSNSPTPSIGSPAVIRRYSA